MKDFVETRIIGAVRKLLVERGNELLNEMEFYVPVIEFGNINGGFAVIPVITLSSCESTEKERIILLDAYALTITFSFPETPEAEMYCYAYAGVVSRAIKENPTLSGIVERAVITGKKYVQPRVPNCGESWEAVLSLRITVDQVVLRVRLGSGLMAITLLIR